MKKILIGLMLIGLVSLVFVASAASAAPGGIKLKPTAGRGNPPDYKTIGNGTAAQAQWTNKVSLDGKFSVLLQKSVPTTDYAFAAAVLDGTEGMTVGAVGDIGFSVNGTCG
ncbi:MAG TPA: hypothetical protein VFB90_07980, partial [Dehalococcoidia bacterium]|nr:hypothetical protein [Dehalococcoidia bacterium]